MTKTAVGLFENSGLVDGVVRDLESNGILRKDIRVVSEPLEIAGEGVLSTPRTDFEVDLTHDLMAFGVAEAEAEAYVRRSSTRRGHSFRNRPKGGGGCRDYESPRSRGDREGQWRGICATARRP